MTPQDVVAIARAEAPASSVATVDAGAHMLVAVPLWEVAHPGELLVSSGLATMGFSLPAAIATALTLPTRRVICFTGDGGLGMALAELETLGRLALDVVVVVFNDATLSLIAVKQDDEGHGGDGATRYSPIDFATVATGCGVRAERANDPSSYRSALRRARPDRANAARRRRGPVGLPRRACHHPRRLSMSGTEGSCRLERRAVPGPDRHYPPEETLARPRWSRLP